MAGKRTDTVVKAKKKGGGGPAYEQDDCACARCVGNDVLRLVNA